MPLNKETKQAKPSQSYVYRKDTGEKRTNSTQLYVSTTNRRCIN